MTNVVHWACCLWLSPTLGIESYPKAQLLIEPEGLNERLDRFVVLDCRPVAAYAKIHIPGAVQVDENAWRTAFGQGDDTKGWSDRIGALGIDGTKTVVVYDDAAGVHAARIWWILKYWGVPDVRLLNGFWHGWTKGNFPVESETRTPAKTTFTAKPQPDRFASKRTILAALDRAGSDLQIVDARSFGEYCGILKLGNPRAGHLPGAKHLDWSQLVDTKGSQRFRSPKEIAQLLEKARIDLSKPVVAHCQGGGRSAVMVFTIELMGGVKAANYHPSFGEWSKDPDAPIVTEPPPAKDP